MSWTSSFPRSIARVYCVRSFVPNDMKSIPSSQMSLIRIAAAGVSIITPNWTLLIFNSLNIARAFLTSSTDIICGNITPNLCPFSARFLHAISSALKIFGCFSENRIPWSPSIGFFSISFGAPSRFAYSSLRISEDLIQIGFPGNCSAIFPNPVSNIFWYSFSLFSFSYAIGCFPAVAINPSSLISPTPSACVFAARSANWGRSTITFILVFVSMIGKISTDWFSALPANTFPWNPSTVISSPSFRTSSASCAPTTAGIPISRETIAACAVTPPSDVTIAEAFCIVTTMSGFVIVVTRMSPCLIFPRSSIEWIIFTTPDATPGEAAIPWVISCPSISASSFEFSFSVVIGLVCKM